MDETTTGAQTTHGMLRAAGVNVTRDAVRSSLHRLDPNTIATRTSHTVQRRRYHVPFVNSVWHIDGQHKLINWKFVIHGAIDGKSHLITWLRASPNNFAETVESLFFEAVDQWGWPSRIRADYGGENLAVKTHMERVQGKAVFMHPIPLY
jgi:hypothetical protein